MNTGSIAFTGKRRAEPCQGPRSCARVGPQIELPSRSRSPDLRRLSMLKASVLLLILGAIYACSALPRKPGIQQMLTTAKTARDHEAIAQYYENEAAEDQAQYEKHQGGVDQYRGITRLHCAQLAQDYKQAQQDASALATYHRKVAEEIAAASGAPASSAPTPSSVNSQ